MKGNHFSVRRIILIILLSTSCGSIMAQKDNPVTFPIMGKKVNLDTLTVDELNLYKERAVKMKNTGMIMTLAGFPIYVTGVFLLVNYAIETPVEERGGFEPKLYAVMTIGGIISSIAGVNLWVTGSRKMKAVVSLKAYSNKTDNSMTVGLGITIRF